MDFSLTDGYNMYLTCVATVNISLYVDMRWNGKGLEQSPWVKQANITREGSHIERKLVFKPWLDSQAGEYTCTVNINDDKIKYTVKKFFIVGGKLFYCPIDVYIDQLNA